LSVVETAFWQISTNSYGAQSGGGADGLKNNPRDKVSIVFKGQDEIMRPNMKTRE